MRDYPFSHSQLNEFSNSLPYRDFSAVSEELFSALNGLKEKYNFPAINNDIGEFISLMLQFWKPKTIFEMGSGYGHSAFWYFQNPSFTPDKIVLTEKRDDLEVEFNSLPLPAEWRSKITYHQRDAFKVIEEYSDIDLALIDGVKSDYLKFLTLLHARMPKGGIVLIDNSYWRGSFLDATLSTTKDSAMKIKELHEFIKESSEWNGVFLPYLDGVSVLVKA